MNEAYLVTTTSPGKWTLLKANAKAPSYKENKLFNTTIKTKQAILQVTTVDIKANQQNNAISSRKPTWHVESKDSDVPEYKPVAGWLARQVLWMTFPYVYHTGTSSALGLSPCLSPTRIQSPSFPRDIARII